MKPHTPAEELIAQTLANALLGNLTVGPFDVIRLGSAAREVESHRIACLALERWIEIDVRAPEILRRIVHRI
jgi:hypothetical protein